MGTKCFEGKDGKMSEVSSSECEIKANLVLLAMGFVSPVQQVLNALAWEKILAVMQRPL